MSDGSKHSVRWLFLDALEEVRRRTGDHRWRKRNKRR